MSRYWLDTNEYPFAPSFFEVNGEKMHYIDQGTGPTLLFVHGTPSWSFEYRNIIKKLSATYRCIAIDHIGFGLSSKPVSYDYSTVNHSASLQKFIQSLNLTDFIMVLHDFGGPIGFNYAVNNPHNVSGMVIMNTWMWSSTGEKEFKKLQPMLRNPLLSFLYRYLNFSPRYLLPRTFISRKLTDNQLKHYTHPFPNRNSRYGPLAFARSLLYDQEWFERLWHQRNVIEKIPALMIWGMKDPLLPVEYLNRFLNAFNHSTALRLPWCGHFPQEEYPDEVAAGIHHWMASVINSGAHHTIRHHL